MNLFETLKQFKNIEPDAAFKEKSKRAILATIPREPWNTRRVIGAIFQTGIAAALGTLFILVLTGQFPGSSFLNSVSPAQFSVIDPATLRAEAQAVDIQIKLANISYTEGTTTAALSSASTLSVAAPKTAETSPLFAPPATSQITAASGSPAEASAPAETSTPVSIDQELQQLSQ